MDMFSLVSNVLLYSLGAGVLYLINKFVNRYFAIVADRESTKSREDLFTLAEEMKKLAETSAELKEHSELVKQKMAAMSVKIGFKDTFQ